MRQNRKFINSKTMLKVLSAIKHHVFSAKAKAREDPAIFIPNVNILLDIYELLSLVDQVCLSLSCKRFFVLFGTAVKREELFFPRLLHIRIPKLCMNKPEVPRHQLLIRLENDRWEYCALCLSLHPRELKPRLFEDLASFTLVYPSDTQVHVFF